MFLFRKNLRNESVSETKPKLFLFLKQKDCNLQTKMKVFPKRKEIFLQQKCFYLEYICETIVLSNQK